MHENTHIYPKDPDQFGLDGPIKCLNCGLYGEALKEKCQEPIHPNRIDGISWDALMRLRDRWLRGHL
jgi:hypothetical protein